MIYYGTEIGMWGANDPCDRQPMLWDDIRHEPETQSHEGGVRKRARQPDMKLHAFYRKAIAMRKAYAVLRRGAHQWVKHPHPRVVIYERKLDGERVRVYLNACCKPVEVALPFSGDDLWHNKRRTKGMVVLPARGWMIVRKG